MHEFAIGGELLAAVLQQLEQLPGKVRLQTVRVGIGALRQIVPEYLTFAFQTLSQQTPAEGSWLEIRIQPIVLECPACGLRAEKDGPPFWCPACGSREARMTAGQELILEQLEFEDSDHAND